MINVGMKLIWKEEDILKNSSQQSFFSSSTFFFTEFSFGLFLFA